ncbi:peptidase M23 [Bacteroidia bacterium]|nr:peptidase M23 [Bacteroidia bacterium]
MTGLFLFNSLFISLCIVLPNTSSLSAQNQSLDNIKAAKEKSEKEIAYLNQLLSETANSKTVSLNKLTIAQKKIAESQKLVGTLNQEVHYLEQAMKENEKKRSALIEQKEILFSMYSKLIYGLWKRRNSTDKLVYLFASSDFNQAYRRYKYFEQIQDYSKRQLASVEKINDSLYFRNQELRRYAFQKMTTLTDIGKQNRDLIKQKEEANNLVKTLTKNEKDIKAKLKKEQDNRDRLAEQLSKLIAAQIKKSGSKTKDIKLTPKEKAISTDFSTNAGKLPWPVAEGVITEKFGITQHPDHKWVKISNGGISISTSKNSEVRSVFEGVVTTLYFMPGMNNVVIIQHGNYFTVYSNLIKVNVKEGQTVTMKQAIGTLAYDKDKGSVLNFQVWQNLNKQDPEWWLAK